MLQITLRKNKSELPEFSKGTVLSDLDVGTRLQG